MQNEKTGQQTMLTSVEKLLEVCCDSTPARSLDPQHWQLTLPRIRWEDGKEDWDWREGYAGRWVAECWWRSRESGLLCFYAKRDLTTMQLREFRELPHGEPGLIAVHPEEERSYLQKALEAIQSNHPNRERSAKLDALWERVAPEDTQQIGSRPRPAHFLISREAVEQWDWEKLRDLILKRENTTVDEIQERIRCRDEQISDDELSRKSHLEGEVYDRQ